ncbi:unnamed protein product [Adineta steineri]|uniref:PLAT domain-containing protein n=1 Tax=Adineta steineri TaxID=433720 RepID=A0A815XPJ6_9BILA|nr:unnamed protein product [Adineta steineri]CAF1559932.1 unnamed protein product [Adineta steineri]
MASLLFVATYKRAAFIINASDTSESFRKFLQKFKKYVLDWFGTVISYEVTFYTCDVSHAGTDANVSLILYATLGNTCIRGLKQKGELTKLHIEHDNSLISPDWFLAKVEVINMDTNEIIGFPCNRWLGKKHNDHEIQQDVLPIKIS